jgi:hypothetical protein
MEWRIRQNGYGGWVAEKGIKVESHPNPNGIGYIMPAFIIYEMSTFKTEKQALRYIKNNT